MALPRIPSWEEDNIVRTPMMVDPQQAAEVIPPPTVAGAVAGSGQGGTAARQKVLLDAGYTPDYQSLLKSDPTLLSNMADLDRLEGQIGIQRREAVRRAVVQAGLVPQGYANGDIDAGTLQAARENQFSQFAELGRSRTRGSTDLAARLAGRGILHSGALSGGESRLQEGYERGTNSVTEALLNSIATFAKESASRQADIAFQRAKLREDAARRISQDPRYAPRPARYGEVPDPVAPAVPTAPLALIRYLESGGQVGGSAAGGDVFDTPGGGYSDPYGSDVSYSSDGTIYTRQPDGSYAASGRWK